MTVFRYSVIENYSEALILNLQAMRIIRGNSQYLI